MEEAPTIESVESAHKAWSEFDPAGHVRLLGQSGAKVCVDSNLTPGRYIRAMNQMEKTSLYYLKNGKQEEAYVLLNKLVTIFIEKLPTHPGFKNLDSKSRAEGKRIVNRAFPVAEDLKAKLTEKLQTVKNNSLQQLEVKRLEMTGSTPVQRVEHERGEVEDRENVATKADTMKTEQDIQIEATLPTSKSQPDPEPAIPPSTLSSSPPPPYPPPETSPLTSRGSVKQLVHSYSKLLAQAESVDSYTKTALPSDAAAPQKNDHRSSHMHTYAVGPMSSRWAGGTAPPPNPLFSLPSQLAASTSSLASPTGNLLTSSLNVGLGGLRNVVIPQDVRQKFESLSHYNSVNKIETCGILCGVLRESGEGEIIQISHLVIPKQRGGPDSCDTLDEQDLFEFQDKNDLITVGWIHTHPTQTAFLSSVDQHTHASYQILLDEAVALVLAPMYNDLGVFSLTSPHGLSYVNTCKKPGFHPHPKVPPLFDTCSHVHFVSALSIQTVDLR